MALPIVIAHNQTASPILLTRIGLTVPASSYLQLTDYAYVHEIFDDESLYSHIDAGDILLDWGDGQVTKGDSLKFFSIVFQEQRSPVRALSDSDVASLSGTTTIDSVSLVAGDRVLLTAQATASQNGIWVVQSGAWTRPNDFNTDQSSAGALVVVTEGTVYHDQVWECTSDSGSDVIDTDNLDFTLSAQNGITLQKAYEEGNTITTDVSHGNVTFTGTQDFVLTLGNFSSTLTGNLTLNAAGTLGIGTSATTGALNLGTGAAARTITVGNSTGATSVAVNTGTGGFSANSLGVLTLDSTDNSHFTLTASSALNKTLLISATNSGGGTGIVNVSASGTIDIGSAGNLTIDSSGGSIGIGTDANTGAINIGTAAAARTITVGNVTGATAVNINAGSGNVTITSPVTTITGDLYVQGTTFQTDTETVLIADNHIYLNNGYSSAVAQTGGVVVNYLPIATTDTVDTGGFTAGVAAVSNPTVVTVGSATFSVGQLIQVSGAHSIENDGLYEVLSHVGTTLTIRGVGTTATVEDFTQNQFKTDATAQGSITRLNVSVIRSGTTGLWEVAHGNTTPFSFTTLATSTGTTLQVAYQNGNTINATATYGDIAFTLTSANFTVDGGQNVDFGATTPVARFKANASGGILLDGGAASHLNATSSNLTVSTTTSGTLAVSSAGALNLSGTTGDWSSTGNVTINSSGGSLNLGNNADAQAINIGTGAAARTITVGNSTGATSMALNVGTGGLNLGTNATDHTTTIGSTTGVSALTAQTGTGAYTINAGGIVDVNATGAVTIDSSGGTIGIGTDANAFAINMGTGAAARTITIGNSTGATSGTWNVGTGGLNLGTNATVHTTTMGSVTGSSATTIQTGTGAMTFTAGGIVDVNATGAVTIDSTGGSLNMGSDANTGAINIGTGAAARTLTIGNNTGATAVIVTSGTEKVQIDGVTHYGKSAGLPTARSGGFQDGDIYFDTGLHMEMRYDGSRTKWLSIEAAYIYFSRNGNTAAGNYYRSGEGLVMSSTSGFTALWNGTITAIGYVRSDTDSATFDIQEGGTSRATLASSATSGRSTTLNANFSAGGILAVANQAGGNTTSDVNGWVRVQWRP